MSRNNYDLRNDPDFKRGVDLWSPRKRRGEATAVPGGTTFIVSNFPAFAHAAIVGTGAASNADGLGGSFINCLTSSATNDSSTVVTAGAATRGNWHPRITFGFAAGNSAASVRWWVGAYEADPSAAAGEGLGAAGIEGACFGYDTGVDGTAFWRCETSDGADSESTVTTVPVTAGLSYTGEIVFDPDHGQVLFYLAHHGSSAAIKTPAVPKLVAAHQTYIPAMNTALLLGYTVTTLANPGAKRIIPGYVALSQD